MGALGFRCLAVAVIGTAAAACNDARTVALAPRPLGATAIALGELHSLLLVDGAILAAGDNADGQLAEARRPLATLTPVDNSRRWAQVAAGVRSTCAVDDAGAVFCVGANERGQLGQGTRDASLVFVEVALPNPVAALAIGETHAVAILTDGTMWGWGANDDAQVSAMSAGDVLTPVQVNAQSDWTLVAAGAGHTCGVDASGQARCFGRNDRGQLGQGTVSTNAPAMAVSGAQGWDHVAAAGASTCGLRGEQLFCWGQNDSGQLGVGDTQDRAEPTAVAGGPWRTVAHGGRAGCALDVGGQLFCFGSNAERQLGTGGPRAVPVTVPTRTFDDRVWSAIAVGGFHTCAISVEGEVFCAGRNHRAQLGFEDLIPRTLPDELLRPTGGAF